MIVVDANLLLYAFDTASDKHDRARRWLETIFSSGVAVGLPWSAVAAFLRVVTNSRIPGKRFTVEEAIQIVDEWLEQPNVRVLAPADQHWSVFRQMLLRGQAKGPLVTDAQLAALAHEYGVVLYSADRDFARFPGLRWINPIEKTNEEV